MQESLTLREVLSVLSKSSPYAVSTERSDTSQNLLDEIKSYLYIQMPIETAVNKAISSFGANDKKVLFLCGSSGDGKSELLTRAKIKHGKRVQFHLDATHSFDPKENAIQTLDKVFNLFETASAPLVVGINTGMLGNYAEAGSNKFFKNETKNYLENKENTDGITFINFEDYPKFQIDEVGYTSEFAQKLLKQLTAKDDNIIRQIYDKDKLENSDEESKRLHVNYELLSIPVVQQAVVDLLFKARLMRDQFLTARSLLDFIFTLIAGPGYLFDNLFAGGDNELANKIIEFDPTHLRTKKIDRFILANDLSLPDLDFKEFKDYLSSIGIENLSDSQSYLRLFYVLKSGSFANNYHSSFTQDFNESLIEQYISIFQLHRDYDDSTEQRKRVRDFYNNTLRAAIRKYNNRNAPNLGKSHYLISELNCYQLVAELDITADTKSLTKYASKSSASFTACLKVMDKCLTIPVNINLLNLVQKIVDGYRPNKHDKNTVVLLDELLDEIALVANHSKSLHVFKGKEQITVKKLNDKEFEVSGM